MTEGTPPVSRPSAKATQRTHWFGFLVGLAIVGALMMIGAPKIAAVVLLGIAGIAILANPNVAIYLFAFLLYTNAPVVASRYHGVPSIVVAGVAGLLLIPLFHQIVLMRKPIIVAPALPLIGLYVAFRILAIVWSEEKDLAVDSTVATIAEGLILYLLLTNVIRDRETLQRVVATLLLAGSLLGALGIYQQVTGRWGNDFGGFAQTSLDKQLIDSGAIPQDARSAGPIGEKNYHAQFMLFLVPLAFAWVKTGMRMRWRCVAAIAAILIMLGIAATASRGAAVGFVVMVGIMIVLRDVRIRHITVIMASSVAILTLVPAFQQRINSMISAVGVLPGAGHIQAIEKSLQGRMSEMWAAAVIFTEHPVVGVGPGNFPPQFLKKAGSLGFQVHTEERMAHCSYLEIAAETGLIGLLLYLSILGVTLRELWHSRQRAVDSLQRNQATAFFLLVCILITTGLFLSFAFERYYWFALALAAVAATTARQPAKNQPAADSGRRSVNPAPAVPISVEVTP